ncbi:hypothetical protein Csa_006601 [Cucumis sativus]|nr:hypothetical protein Csa_006601 [Cucumis sativus]
MRWMNLSSSCFPSPAFLKLSHSISQGTMTHKIISFNLSEHHLFKSFSYHTSNHFSSNTLHAKMVKIGSIFVSGKFVLTSYVKSEKLNDAQKLFDEMPNRDVLTWTALISGFSRVNSSGMALQLFREMLVEALELLYEMVENESEFNNFTSSIALSVVSSLLILELGRQVHGRIVRCGLHNDGFVKSALINMYIKCGNLEKASVIYSRLPSGFATKQSSNIVCSDTMTEIVSRSSMVYGYVRNGKYEDAFKTFVSMVRERVLMDKFTIANVVSACSNAGVLELGRQVHGFIHKTVEQLDAHLASSLIDMYAKGGSLDCAHRIFDQMTNYLNVVIWTSMIVGCALHGHGKEAIRLFEQMRYEGIIPNEVTFIGVLTACSHAGLLEDGHLYFNMMKDVYAIKPKVEHYTCMVDLYGRAGLLNEVKEFIYENDLSHLSAVWKAFLSSCRLYRDLEMGKWVSEKLFRLKPQDEGSYVLLSNMCSGSQKWEEASRARRSMQHSGINKTPGQSWIHLKNQVHSFVAGDQSHPQHAQIYEYLDKLIGRLKEIGYLHDVKLVMQDVEEEQGEVLLGWHSEKLAVAYGIISLGSAIPIRIMKNLRICTDCHNFMKLTSQLLGREIIVRDIYRFHHFNSGHCSCGDYW